jgi:hypothetical protein
MLEPRSLSGNPREREIRGTTGWQDVVGVRQRHVTKKFTEKFADRIRRMTQFLRFRITEGGDKVSLDYLICDCDDFIGSGKVDVTRGTGLWREWGSNSIQGVADMTQDPRISDLTDRSI